MTGWVIDKAGVYHHPWCGMIASKDSGWDGKPTRWAWSDRAGRERATFSTLAEAKRVARKLSGVQLESER